MKTKCMSCGGSMKKMQKGGSTKKKPLLPAPKSKTGMDALKALFKYVSTFGFATEGYNPAPSKKAKKTTPKMAVGGTTTKRIIKKSTGGMYGIPQENLGTSGQYGFAQKGGVIKAVKKVVKKITRPTLRKAQNGIEMDDSMMINKPGSTGGYKAPVRPASEYMSGKPGGVSGRTPGRARPNARPPMTRQDMINVGKDKNSPYYGASEQDMIKKGMISKPPYKKGGATKAAKFAALAPPYNKATFADRIAGAKKSVKKKK